MEKVDKIIEWHLGVRAKDIKPDSRLVLDFDADSLDMVELCMFLEEEFDVTVPDEDIDKWHTVSDLYEYFRGKG